MPTSDPEIVVEDPREQEDRSPAVTTTAKVEAVVYVLLIVLALVLGYDNYRSGMGWAKDGPQSGYMPFYLCVILAAASLFGLGHVLIKRWRAGDTFVSRDQFRRVLQVFLPTFLFCLATQWLGIYCASFLLSAGFMRIVGWIAWWKSILTAIIFALAMFLPFDVAFDVLMPKGQLEALFGY